MARNRRQMIIAIATFLAVAALIVVSFVGCQYRAPSEVDVEPPSPLPHRSAHL